jgi:hypothetical protein
MDLSDDDHLYDDHLTRSLTELGEPDALFRVSRGRLLAKLALGVLLLVYGVVANYLWFAHGPGTFGHFELILLLVVPLSGAALLWHMYRQRGLYVLVYPTGLLRLRRGEVDSFPWREVEHVRLKVQRAAGAEITRGFDGAPTACWLPAEVPTFQLWNAGLSVVRGDGVEAHFGPALTDYDRLAEEVQRRTFAVLWPAVWNRFTEGGAVAFGDLELSRVGLRHAGKFLTWPDVKEPTIAQGKVSIKQGGKWLPWALLDVQAVPNPHVLFALVAEAKRVSAGLLTQPNPHAAG